ncbi:MAG: FeoA domain-containing protein [Helicobacteraceae bacterium]|jgi:Fe2+ transport system protein FeoA|nr:FeoA domain-containing protein [Helicobacteraceae bacterium]
MSLLHMKIGEMVAVDAINVNSVLKQRLCAMGLTRDAHICVKHFGCFKSTVQIRINRSLIALRKDEARLIEVHPLVA